MLIFLLAFCALELLAMAMLVTDRNALVKPSWFATSSEVEPMGFSIATSTTVTITAEKMESEDATERYDAMFRLRGMLKTQKTTSPMPAHMTVH